MTIKHKILNELMDVTKKMGLHVQGYIDQLKIEIEYQLLAKMDDLKDDYFTSEDERLNRDYTIAFRGIKGHLAHVCDKLKDTASAFYDHNGDNEYTSPSQIDEEIEEILEEYEDDQSFVEDEDLDKHGVYDKLKMLSEAYHLSDHQMYQDDILNLLREEFNLNLVCLPAKNK